MCFIAAPSAAINSNIMAIPNQTNELRQTLLEFQSFNEHFEHAGYRYWTYRSRTTGERIYKRLNLVSGEISRISQEDYSLALGNASKKRGANVSKARSSISHKPTSLPKPTESERRQFLEQSKVSLTTKQGKDFQVDVRGNIESWQSFFNESSISPSHIIKETLSAFVDEIDPDELYVKLYENSYRDKDEFDLIIGAEQPASKSMCKQYIKRMFTINRKDKSISVEHCLFKIDDKKQGNGFSRSVMIDALNLYESMGVSEVELTASLDIGKYVWAKYGFVPSNGNFVSSELNSELSKHPAQFPPGSEIHKDLTDLIEELKTDPTALWRIADYDKPVADDTYLDPTTGKPMKAGKALMLIGKDFGWHGVADLNDSLTVDRWRQYCNKAVVP